MSKVWLSGLTPSLQHNSVLLSSKRHTKPQDRTLRPGTTRVRKGKNQTVKQVEHLPLLYSTSGQYEALTFISWRQPSLQPVNPLPETHGNLYPRHA
jgi:hypothetical protein